MSKKKRNKGFLVLWIITIILFVADLTTTLLVREYAPFAESNPLYQATQSFVPVILANFIVVGLLYWVYHHAKTRVYLRYMVIALMIMLVLPRIVAIGHALEYAEERPPIEEIKDSITPTMRAETVKANALLFYAPFLLAVLSFLFWKWDHKIQRKDE